MDKHNWLSLAFAPETSLRRIALETMLVVAPLVQEELLVWYAFNLDPRIILIMD